MIKNKLDYIQKALGSTSICYLYLFFLIKIVRGRYEKVLACKKWEGWTGV